MPRLITLQDGFYHSTPAAPPGDSTNHIINSRFKVRGSQHLMSMSIQEICCFGKGQVS
jgi:hypothetical protein